MPIIFHKTIIIIIAIGLIQYACIDPIDFAIERENIDQLVIDGRIVELLSEEYNYAEINVGRVFNFESTSRSTISVEEVSISNGTQILQLAQTGLGTYRATFKDSDYSLGDELTHILTVKDLSGRIYESAPVKKSQVAIPESLGLESSSAMVINSLGDLVEEERLSIVINTPILSQENNAIHWEVSQTYQVNSVTPALTCYVTENPVTDRVLVLDTRSLSAIRLDNYPLFQVPIDKRFREGISFNVRQFSTDEATLVHLTNIQSLLTITETVFNNPLHKLGTNIKNVGDPIDEVFGHFYASQAIDIHIKQDSIRPYCNRTPPEGNDNRNDAICDQRTGCPISGQGADPLCCDCTKVSGATILRPSYW